MPKLSEAAYAERRHRIVEAAKRCFAAHGIHVSVDEICAEAGVSKGALYGYFKSKDAIIEAIAADHARSIDAFESADSIETLAALLMERMSDADVAACRLELEAWTYGIRRKPLLDLLSANSTRLHEAIGHSLQTMQDAGRVTLAMDPTAAAHLLATFATGVIASSAFASGGRMTDAESSLRHLLALIRRPASTD